MLFFNRLFAVYYFMYCRLRKFDIFRRGQDWQAVNVVTICQMLLIGVIILPLRTLLSDDIRQVLVYTWWLPLPFLYFVNNKYYLSKRERRNAIIDDVRYMRKGPKLFWKLAAILTPVLLFTLLMIEMGNLRPR